MNATCAGGFSTTDIVSLMAVIDCNIAAFIERAYGGLFGAGGYFSPVLLGALTIYVALYGYRLLSGRGVTANDLLRRFVMLGAILAFSSNWPAYQTVFVNTIISGGDEIAQTMSAAISGRPIASHSIAEGIGETIDDMASLAENWSRKTPLDGYAPGTPGIAPAPAQSAPGGFSAASMLWISAILFAVSSAGVLIATKSALALLLALGPLFIMLGAFPSARGLMLGWLRIVVAGALALALTLLATAGALTIIGPMIEGIESEQSLGVNNSEAVLALMILCIVFAMLVRQIVSSITHLASAWRLPGQERGEAHATAPVPTPAAQPAHAIENPRILELVAAAGRETAGERNRAQAMSATTTPLLIAAPREDESGTRRAPRAYRGFGSSGGRVAGGAS